MSHQVTIQDEYQRYVLLTGVPMITCLFSCEGCGLVDSPVRVKAREANEDVVHWFEKVCIAAVADQHALLSPVCNAKKLTELKVPMDNEEGSWIGKQTDSVPPRGRPDDRTQQR